MSRQKKNLNEISLGELKMLYAQIECDIQSHRKEIQKVDDIIIANLQKSKLTIEDFELQSLARRIAECTEEKRMLIQKFETLDIKRASLHRLILMKEKEAGLSIYARNTDILDTLDIESLSESQEKEMVRNKLNAAHTEKLFSVVSENRQDELDRILAVIKATSLDDESIACAKADIDDIMQV